MGSNRPRLSLVLALALAAATLAVYADVHTFGFVNFDDDLYVTANATVQAGLTAAGVKWAFTAIHAANWHPVTWISHMIDVELFGLDAGAHHLVNVAFHTTNVVLLFVVLHRMTKQIWPSVLVAGLWGVHPQHVESVAWIAERRDVLVTLFCLLTMWAYAAWAETGRRMLYIASLAAFAVALMCKPMAVTLPFALLLLDYWPLRRAPSPRLLLEKLPLLALAVASITATVVAQSSASAVKTLDAYPLPVRIANAIVSYAEYVLDTLWPVDLAVLYPHTGMPGALTIAVSAATLVAISTVAIALHRRTPAALVGWLWYLGTLVPVIGLVQVGGARMADRYVYIPHIGLFIAIIWMAREAVRMTRIPGFVSTGLAVVVIASFGVAARAQAAHWRDGVTLFTHTLAVTANNGIAHNNLGRALEERGEGSSAIEHYERAIALNPRDTYAHFNLGNVLSSQGKLQRAITHYDQAVRMDPNQARFHNNFGNALRGLGDTAAAYRHFQIALRLEPSFAEAHNNLGAILAQQGKLTQAIEHFSRAIAINPAFSDAQFNLETAKAHARARAPDGP